MSVVMLQHEANQAGRYLKDGFSPQQLGDPLKLFYGYVQVTALTHLKPSQGVSFNFWGGIILFYTYHFPQKIIHFLIPSPIWMD